MDLYYTLETPLIDETTLPSYSAYLQNSRVNIGYSKNHDGQILKIGRRTSDRFSRIYTRNNQLRFEHEMKGEFIQTYSPTFMRKAWNEFEEIISNHFLQYFGKHLPLDSIYLEWLVIKLRSIKPESRTNLLFTMDSITSVEKIQDQKKVVQFLKLLIYLKGLSYVTESLGETNYRCLSFRFQDFLKFQDPSLEQVSSYQLQKLNEFFTELQTDFLVSVFRDSKFQKLISIPKVEIWREKNNYWMVRLWIVDELFDYTYPFSFPDIFSPKISKLKFAVQFEIIRVFSSGGLEKRFHVRDFIQKFQVSNQRIREIKEFFLEGVNLLLENDLIHPEVKILRKGNLESVDELTSQNISEGFVVYEKLDFLDLRD